jgi:transposase
MKDQVKEVFVGIDVAKASHAVALAESGRSGEVRIFGTISATPEAVRRLVTKLSKNYERLCFCYEAGPTGYGLYRQLMELGHECIVIAPSLTPVRSGDRIKTDRRDAVRLARLFRAGELTAIWVPDATHEAMRDLVRARQSAVEDLRCKRQMISSLMLKHGRSYPGKKTWGARHQRWLQQQKFDHPGHQIALQEMVLAERHARERVDRLMTAIEELVPGWSLGGAVEALQSLRGVALIGAVTFMTEVGDVRRFEHPRQLMAFLGLVPSEYSTGMKTQRGGITKAGNARVRRTLIEGAWAYRWAPRVGAQKLYQHRKVSAEIQDIAWKAQSRLTGRYRRLTKAGKKSTVATTAVARELVGFMWDIARRSMPTEV